MIPIEVVAEAKWFLLSTPLSLNLEAEFWLEELLFNEGSAEEAPKRVEAIELDENFLLDMKDMKLKALKKFVEILARRSDEESKNPSKPRRNEFILLISVFSYFKYYKRHDMVKTLREDRVIRDVFETTERIKAENVVRLKRAQQGSKYSISITGIATSSVVNGEAYGYQMPSLDEIVAWMKTYFLEPTSDVVVLR